MSNSLTNRRDALIKKIESRCDIRHTGHMVEGKPSPCHLWKGPTSGTGRGGGYGRMSLNSQTVATHLVAFTHYYGYIPGNRQVDHECNQRLCCNPQHLKLVTHLRNQKLRAKRKKLTCLKGT